MSPAAPPKRAPRPAPATCASGCRRNRTDRAARGSRERSARRDTTSDDRVRHAHGGSPPVHTAGSHRPRVPPPDRRSSCGQESTLRPARERWSAGPRRRRRDQPSAWRRVPPTKAVTRRGERAGPPVDPCEGPGRNSGSSRGPLFESREVSAAGVCGDRRLAGRKVRPTGTAGIVVTIVPGHWRSLDGFDAVELHRSRLLDWALWEGGGLRTQPARAPVAC